MKARTLATLTAFVLASLAATSGSAQTGSADFSRYVAMGDSLTAAFISGGLHVDSQGVSYPQLIYTQATGSSSGFQQPIVIDPGIPPVLELRGLSPLVVVPKSGELGIPINFGLDRPYDNLAVPGANVADVVNTVTGGLHDVVLRGAGTQLQQAIFLEPTFVSLWIGNNDALGAATSGIVLDGVTLTTVDDFSAAYRTIVQALVGNGVTGGVLATIPDVTAIPFVSTLPPVLIGPDGAPLIVNGAPVPLIGPDGPLSLGDFVLLTASGELAAGNGIPVAFGGNGRPLSDNAVLSAAEARTINQRVNAFNNVIRNLASEAGWAVAETGAAFAEIKRNGLSFAGVELTTDFLTGGLFSFDGVHPTQLGYALAANAFIEAINGRYGATLTEVGLGQFVFTDLGQAAGFGQVPPDALSTNVVFSQAAYKQLRQTFGTPKPRKLRKMKKRAERLEARQGRVRRLEAADRGDAGRRAKKVRKVRRR